jgi:hypothetical protein
MPGLFDRLQDEIQHRDKVAGLSPVDLLDMPDAPRRILLLLMRQGEMTLPALAAALGPDGEDAAALEAALADLARQAFVLRREVAGQAPSYRTSFGQRRRRDLPLGLWSMLEGRVDEGGEEGEP